MLIEVKVPQLSESVSEATLVSWHKKEGDAVSRDENLIDIETDKVVLETPAPADGVLVKIVKNGGDSVTSGEIIATIDTEAKAAAGAPAAAAAPAGSALAAAAPKQEVYTLRKKLDAAIAAKDAAVSKTTAIEYVSAMDKATKSGVVHKNAASRAKSRTPHPRATRAILTCTRLTIIDLTND